MKRIALLLWHAAILSGCVTLDPNFCGSKCIKNLDEFRHANNLLPDWYADGGPGLPVCRPFRLTHGLWDGRSTPYSYGSARKLRRQDYRRRR